MQNLDSLTFLKQLKPRRGKEKEEEEEEVNQPQFKFKKKVSETFFSPLLLFDTEGRNLAACRAKKGERRKETFTTYLVYRQTDRQTER